jgi:hypothetical protein
MRRSGPTRHCESRSPNHEPAATLRLCSLTAIAQNDDARAEEFCALPENPAGLNGFDDGEEAKPVINRIGNPTVSPGNVAKRSSVDGNLVVWLFTRTVGIE